MLFMILVYYIGIFVLIPLRKVRPLVQCHDQLRLRAGFSFVCVPKDTNIMLKL
jgi:hypothetical protein